MGGNTHFFFIRGEMLRALSRFIFFVLPAFIIYGLADIIFDNFEIGDFKLLGDKRPQKFTPEQIEAAILRKHLEKCFKLVEKNKAKNERKKETDT